MNEKLKGFLTKDDPTDSLMKRCEALEAEQKRVATQLEAVTRKMAELENDQIKMLQIMIESQNTDVEFGKELLNAIKAFIDADVVEGSTKSSN